MPEPRDNEGLVVLAGAGPGAAGLVTVAAAEWLARADVVVYDRLVDPSLLDRCRNDAERIYVGKSPGEPTRTQEQINELLVDRCRAGRLVVRLKGGDPYVFGRGGEEAEHLARCGCAFRVIPGVTAALAAGACAGIPLTHRAAASAVTFVTGHEDPTKDGSSLDYSALARTDTIVLYMSVGTLAEVTRRLIRAGRGGRTPAAVVASAASPRQRTVRGTLDSIAGDCERAGLRPPAVVIIGNVAATDTALPWYERLPLFGQTIITTRPAERDEPLSRRLAELGAEVIAAPAIAICPPASSDELDDALGRIGGFDWLVLTSANGVAAVFDCLDALGADARALAPVRVAAIGSATAAALQEHGLRADLTPGSYTSAALAAALVEAGAGESTKLLLARADIAGDELPGALRAAGAEVEEVVAYRTVRPAGLPDAAVDALGAGRVDWITFTSASTVDNFLDLCLQAGVGPGQTRLATIGPVTAAAIRKRGLTPAVVADPHTLEGLVDAILSSAAEE